MTYTYVYTTVLKVVRQVKTKINKVGSRHTIYLQKDLIEDSNFPFKAGETIIVRIDGSKLIIEHEDK
jgi:hypothetical protein